MPRKYGCNQHFFKTIITQGQAYFLGFFAGAGYTKNGIEIKLSLHHRDKYIIESFNKEIGGNYPIKLVKNTSCLTINNKTMITDLVNIFKNHKFPEHVINEELFHHFIRGYFDANSRIYINKGYPAVSFAGSKPFITILRKKLRHLCDLPNTNIKPSGNAYELSFNGASLLKIRDFIYKDAKIYLTINREKFDLLDKSISFLNKIFNDDCLNILPLIPSNCVDLVITSPPYNTGLEYDSYKDNKPYKIYINWLKSIFQQLYRCLKPGGRCIIIIGDQKNGRVPTHVNVTHMMTNILKYLPMATIVWNKRNTSNRTSWGSFASPKAPSLPTPFEYVLVFAKKYIKTVDDGETDLTNKEFVEWAYALWTLDRTDYKTSQDIINKKIHPSAYPEPLIERCIKMFSWKEAVILDPFLGSGTTAIVAKRLNRKYVGIEISPDYYETAKKRVRNIVIPYKLI